MPLHYKSTSKGACKSERLVLRWDGGLERLVLDSGLDLQNNLLPALGQEQARLQQLVRRKVITDSTKSIYGKALLGGASSKEKATHLVERHSRILELEKHEYHWDNYDWVAGNPQGNVSIVLATDLSSVSGVRAAYLVLKHAESKEGAARFRSAQPRVRFR